MAEPNSVESGRTEHWRRVRGGLTRAEFEAQHPYPFLVWIPGARSNEHVTGADRPQMSFHTQVHGPRVGALSPDNAMPSETLFLPVRKAPGNPFPERISVGRAPNCDVVIRDASISKLHGHFSSVTARSSVFTDAKSANGTRIDGMLVAPGTSVPISKFAYVSLGRVRLQLWSAADVYDSF